MGAGNELSFRVADLSLPLDRVVRTGDFDPGRWIDTSLPRRQVEHFGQFWLGRGGKSFRLPGRVNGLAVWMGGWNVAVLIHSGHFLLYPTLREICPYRVGQFKCKFDRAQCK